MTYPDDFEDGIDWPEGTFADALSADVAAFRRAAVNLFVEIEQGPLGSLVSRGVEGLSRLCHRG